MCINGWTTSVRSHIAVYKWIDYLTVRSHIAMYKWMVYLTVSLSEVTYVCV